MCLNGLTDLTEIWNQDTLGDDASFEYKFPFWEIGPGTFKLLWNFWWSNYIKMDKHYILSYSKIFLSIGQKSYNDVGSLIITCNCKISQIHPEHGPRRRAFEKVNWVCYLHPEGTRMWEHLYPDSSLLYPSRIRCRNSHR